MLIPYAFNGLAWVSYLSLVLFALIVKPFSGRAVIFLPIFALTAYVLLSTTGTFAGDYGLGLSWLTLFWFASDYILLTDVQRTLRRLPPAPKEPIEKASLCARTRWAVALFTAPRGVGWAHQPPTLPAAPLAGTPRLAFIVRRLCTAFLLFLLHDAANLHQLWNPMFRAHGPGWRADGWGWRAIVVLAWGVSAYTAMELAVTLLSVMGVACGLFAPEEWPPLFAPGEAYTIRRLWGRAWHQLMRRFVSTHGKYLAHCVLRLSPGSNASSYIQLYTAFLISALVHYGAEAMALRIPRGGGALAFFMLQPCAIMLEDFLIFLARGAGMKGGTGVRIVGYAWVWVWVTLTLPGWQEPLVRAGQMDDSLPVSVLLGLWRGEWVLHSRS
ncbi:membrane bound O-acyl transferase family-domain-containing protein [Mycena albidolilacea]|uniref:Membrane bound O-acyl transferase family-domain-containing protein n=1 Tax=Mycena albidolilacea TaxID=1033008 RepID=A0AAD7E7U2_9AGAR|nr:membrane bound O-acyl transferase family-domain-containing protein [Mycena albidolilacea]